MKTTILSLFAVCSFISLSAQTEDFPQWQPESNYPVKLMSESTFFLKKDWNKVKKQTWTGLFEHRGGTNFTEIAQFSPTPAADPMEYGAEDPKYTGIEANIKNRHRCIILMASKTVKFTEQSFEWVDLTTSTPAEYKGATYSFQESFSERHDDDGNPNGYGDYSLEIFVTKDGKITSQKLIQYSQIVGDIMPAVLFVGDLDGDDKLDFLIDTTNNAMLYQPTLYLSSQAKAGEVVKLAGILAVGGC